jgi:N-glycosylase/DNA lyase
LVSSYRKYIEDYNTRPSWEALDETELWLELCFCILSSNVPYEMATSALHQLSQKGFLETSALAGGCANLIAEELSRPIYHPARRDGSLRVYRFPRKRAHDLVGAWRYLYTENAGLTTLLEGRPSPPSLRSILVSGIPGMGIKEASHFLRNVKYTDSIAVLDSHVVSFMNQFVTPPLGHQSLTPHRYVELEVLFIGLARDLGFCPAVFDMAIWEYMRKA